MQSIAPHPEHVTVWRKHARLLANEEIIQWRDDHYWLLELADAEQDDWPAEVTFSSKVNATAVIEAARAELAWRASKGITKQPSSMGWDKALLERLKASLPIEKEIGRFVPLARRGKALRGSCPFHKSESGQSFVVFPDDNGWWCFGCQTGGDIFSWVQAYHHLAFRQAVFYVANETGIELPAERKEPVMIIEKGRS